jgi:outer membrane protein assembly factor BamB
LDSSRTVWTAPLASAGLGGVAATEHWVVATDCDPRTKRDVLKVFEAPTGRLALAAELIRPDTSRPDPPIDYGNSVRTTPVIHAGQILVLDAFGTLFLCDLPKFGAPLEELTVEGIRTETLVDGYELATWGVASTPLVVDGKLIVNVCGTQTSLVALSPKSLKVLWQAPGRGTGFASCLAGQFGGHWQVIGYESEALSGWDVKTGERLWSIQPDFEGDYNVPTPVAPDDRHLMVTTENNATRMYAFDDRGKLSPTPIAVNDDVMTDTVTPVVAGGLAYCTSGDSLYCLDVDDQLRTRWSLADDAFANHVSLIGDTGGKRLLVVSHSGELVMLDIAGSAPKIVSRYRPLGLSPDEPLYSHPALVGNRLYVRFASSLCGIVF